VSSMPAPDALRDRFLTTFFAAWPDRDIPDERIRSSLRLVIESDADGRALVVQALGSTISFGFAAGDPVERVADELARHLAEQAEGDRWSGGAWREYEPGDQGPDGRWSALRELETDG